MSGLEIIGICCLFVIVIVIASGGGVNVSVGDINIGSNNRKKTQSK